nr:retrovirus-related Pol polyprotein from transposon TNT 1-94 [Tanacetum cinerariifolium]
GSSFDLTAFSDADHAECIDSLKSTSGGIQFLGDKLVSWMLKKQNCTSMFLAEAEYVALSASCAQVMWMRTRLQDYGFNYNKILLYCDSQSAIAISCNPVQHSRTKHIHTRYHFIKEQVENGIIELYFVRTEYQLGLYSILEVEWLGEDITLLTTQRCAHSTPPPSVSFGTIIYDEVENHHLIRFSHGPDYNNLKWPLDWSDKYHFLNSLNVPWIYDEKRDTLVWRDVNDTFKPFSSSSSSKPPSFAPPPSFGNDTTKDNVDGDLVKGTNVVSFDESFHVLNTLGNLIGGSPKLVKGGMDSSFVDPKVMKGWTSQKHINAKAKVKTPKASILDVHSRFCFSLYGYFMGKRVAFPVVENYVKNAWKKLSVMATKLGNQIMLDSYRSFMCLLSWGRLDYARALIDIRGDGELKEDMVDAIPNVEDDGVVLHTVRVEINELESQKIEGKLVLLDDDEKPLKPSKSTLPNVVSKNVDDLVNEDNGSEVEEVTFEAQLVHSFSPSFGLRCGIYPHSLYLTVFGVISLPGKLLLGIKNMA